MASLEHVQTVGDLVRVQIHKNVMEGLYIKYAQDLQGTCNYCPDWEDWFKEHLELYPDTPYAREAQVEFDENRLYDVLSELAPECTQCGWYGYEGEVANYVDDQAVCDDCYEEGEEND